MKVKAKSLIRVIILLVFCFVLFYFINKKGTIEVTEIDKNKIEEFDLILSKGQSFQSKIIGFLKLHTEDYTHIGILVKDNNELFVLHSTPDGTKTNGIRQDNLQTFINLSCVSEYTILRYQSLSYDKCQKLKIEISRYKKSQIPFDYDFNNFDHRKIYCSELVCLIFKNSGLSTLSEFDLTNPIYPNYFFKMKSLVVVNTKKTSL